MTRRAKLERLRHGVGAAVGGCGRWLRSVAVDMRGPEPVRALAAMRRPERKGNRGLRCGLV